MRTSTISSKITFTDLNLPKFAQKCMKIKIKNQSMSLKANNNKKFKALKWNSKY